MNTDFPRITAYGWPNMKLRRPIPRALIVPLRAPRASHCTTAAVPTILVLETEGEARRGPAR
jgi:hypothetical protein